MVGTKVTIKSEWRGRIDISNTRLYAPLFGSD